MIFLLFFFFEYLFDGFTKISSQTLLLRFLVFVFEISGLPLPGSWDLPISSYDTYTVETPVDDLNFYIDKVVNQVSLFGCPKCDKSYRNLNSLVRHRRYQCKKPPCFQCAYCDHKAYQKVHVANHIRKIHKGQPIDIKQIFDNAT